MTMQFKFANYTFDAHAGLSYDGQAVHLPPKEKGLLQLLLSARGQVVRKDDLVTKVWGNSDASDESISRAVYRLRVAMQSSGGPEIVETVYNSGFRITVPIRISSMEESASLNAFTQSRRPNAVAALISAREFVARRSADDVEAAANAARMAISVDPGFAAAWSTLAEIRVFQATRSLRPPREAGWLAKEAAQAALEIDPASASALSVRGWVRVLIDQDHQRGLEDVDRAIAQDPDYWVASLMRGWVLQAAGRHAESVDMMRRALELNSVGHSVNSILSLYLMYAGLLDEALDVALELAKRFPTIDNAQGIASIVCSVHGRHEEAIDFGQRAMELAPHTPIMQAPLASALALAGQHADARRVLAVIEASKLPQPSASMAPIYLALGERERAIEKLMDASERGVPQFAWTRDDPRLASLHGEPIIERAWSRIWSSTLISA
jgi:DNA-binding winged helix-turn-helix (wHTH) protein/Tfp pilus assembly protein PilF